MTGNLLKLVFGVLLPFVGLSVTALADTCNPTSPVFDDCVTAKMKPAEVTTYNICYNLLKTQSFFNIPPPIDDGFERLIGKGDGTPSDKNSAYQDLQTSAANTIFNYVTKSDSPLKKEKEFNSNIPVCPLSTLTFGSVSTQKIDCGMKSDFTDLARCKYIKRHAGIYRGGVRSVLAGSLVAAFAEELSEANTLKSSTSGIQFPTDSTSICWSKNSAELYAKNYCAFQAMKASPEISKDCFAAVKYSSSSSSSAISQQGQSLLTADCATSMNLRMAYRSLNALYGQLAVCQIKEKALKRHQDFKAKIVSGAAPPEFTQDKIKSQVSAILQNDCTNISYDSKVPCVNEHYSSWAYDQLNKAFNASYPAFTPCQPIQQ